MQSLALAHAPYAAIGKASWMQAGITRYTTPGGPQSSRTRRSEKSLRSDWRNQWLRWRRRNELLQLLRYGAKTRMNHVEQCVSRRAGRLRLLRLHCSDLILFFEERLAKLSLLGFLFRDLHLQRRDLVVVDEDSRTENPENEPKDKHCGLFHSGRPPVAQVAEVSLFSSLQVNNPLVPGVLA